MKVNFEKYFNKEKNPLLNYVKIFVAFLLVFAIIFFLWSVMKYNKLMEEKRDKEVYISQLSEKIDRLEYLVDMPLDDSYKIRVAREMLGMCFPDEMIFYTDIE